MKFSTCLVSLLVLSTATFGSVLASHAQKDSPAPVSQSAPMTPPGTPPSASPEVPPATPPGTPPDASPAMPPSTPPSAPAETAPAPSAPVKPDGSSSGGSTSSPTGGGSLSTPTSSSSGTSSTALAMCGKNGASFLIDTEQAPVGCTESKINRPPAAALK